MSSVAEKIQKRRCYPVEIGGDTLHLRALSVADRRRVEGIVDIVQKAFFAIGRGLCEANGDECFPRVPDEDDTAYAARIESLFPEIPTDTFNELSEAINKIGIVPRTKVLEKN